MIVRTLAGLQVQRARLDEDVSKMWRVVDERDIVEYGEHILDVKSEDSDVNSCEVRSMSEGQ